MTTSDLLLQRSALWLALSLSKLYGNVVYGWITPATSSPEGVAAWEVRLALLDSGERME